MSRRPDAAYPLISNRLEHYSNQLLTHFPKCNFWIHESVVARFIGLPTNEEYGQSQALTALLLCIKNGYGGSKRNKTIKATTHNATDLKNEHNVSGICYQEWGRKEEFDQGSLALDKVKRHTRWFKFGDGCTIELGEQLDLLNEIIGVRVPLELTDHDPTIKVPVYAAKRRSKYYKLFYNKQRTRCQPYLNYDVPAITARHKEIFGVTMNSTQIRRRSFDL